MCRIVQAGTRGDSEEATLSQRSNSVTLFTADSPLQRSLNLLRNALSCLNSRGAGVQPVFLDRDLTAFSRIEASVARLAVGDDCSCHLQWLALFR